MLSDERLAEIEARLAALRPHADTLGMRSIADDLGDLLAEVRRLKRENNLLHLSRGTPVGVD